jgi:glycosyltransferase involved in cell wall biosynthesis
LIKSIGGLRAPTLFWSDTWQVARALKAIQPDVVHAWGTERGAGLVASRLGYPYVLTMQGLLDWLRETTKLDLYHRFAALLEKPSLRRASTVTVESAFGVNYLRARYPHLALHQVEHAPLPLFHQVVRNPQTEPLRILFVGTLSAGKGCEVMLNALERLKNEIPFELVIVGGVDQSKTDHLKARTSPELCRRVRFAGIMDAKSIAQELAQATLFLYPTLCDNSPNAVKEAVVAGVPVVASAIGGIVDYVWPDQNGRLFQAGDAEACLAAVRSAIGHPLFSRGRVEATALNKVRAYLSAETMAQYFVELYRQAARQGSGEPKKVSTGRSDA